MQIKTTALLTDDEITLTFTDKPVTPWGGMVLFAKLAKELGLARALRESLPFTLTSPNATDPVDIIVAFMSGVLTGSRRFSHLDRLRHEKALHFILGLRRFVTDSTFSRFFGRFGQKQVDEMFSRLARWQLSKAVETFEVPVQGCTLDLDSTVFERYGHQEGAVLGFNPKKHRRPSHHPLLAMLADIPIVVHAWLRSGNTSSHRGAVQFLMETLDLLPERLKICHVRADSGFAVEAFLAFLEQRSMTYAISAKFTKGLQNKVAGMREEDWREIAPGIVVGEVEFQAQGWSCSRRVILVRERTPKKDFVRGRELFDNPAYVYQAILTNRSEAPEYVWRYQRGRSDCENRIRELKWDYGIDGFCLKKFFSTEAAFRLICLTYNLMVIMERKLGNSIHRTLGVLRSQVLACGAILGKAGRKTMLRLSLKGEWRDQFMEWIARLSPSEKTNCVAVGSG